MSERASQDLKKLQFRSRLPKYVGISSLVLIAVTLAAIGIGYYRARSVSEFRMKGFPTELSKDVVVSVNEYERREMDGDTVLYHLKADKATTFSDAHQELENVHLQIFNGSDMPDDISAGKAVYIPEENKNFTAYFANAVTLSTRGALRVKTDQVTYKSVSQTAVADEHLAFERANIRGESFGGVVNIANKTLELGRDVRVEIDGGRSRLNAGSAIYDQQNDIITLQQGVEVYTAAERNETQLRAARATVRLIGNDDTGRSVASVELHENVSGRRTSGERSSEMSAGYALYEYAIDKFDLRDSVSVTLGVATASANHIVYEPTARRASMEGGAQIARGNELVKGDHIAATFFDNSSLQDANAKGNAFLRRAAADGTADLSANEMNAVFSGSGELKEAIAAGRSVITSTPSDTSQYSKVTVDAARGLKAFFRPQGLVERVDADGRTVINLDAPDNGRNSSNKQIAADNMSTSFASDGKSLVRAEGVGNAELQVIPHRASQENYKLKVNAARVDCDFFSVGSVPKVCVGSGKTNALRTPTIAEPGHGEQRMSSERLTASFSEQNRNVERLDANGSAKFSETDQNAVAETFSFTTSDEVLRLRGGEPTGWNNEARLKAKEIDWDTRNRRSFYRGSVSTTYYSQNSTGGATPFGNSAKPVYLTAQVAEIDHNSEVAVYTGNARSWQGNNYVRGDRLSIDQRQKRMTAEGTVTSLLYDAKRREGGGMTTVPVYAAARSMTYDSGSRIIRYENDVEVRQGSDRISGSVAVIHLGENNDLARSEFQTNVVVVQPRRKAFASYAIYTSGDDTIVLRGNPARIEDNETGTAQGSELILNLRDNRFSGAGTSKENPAGRVRSVYRLKTN